MEGPLPAAASEPQWQRAVDPGLHGQGWGGARGMGPSSHPAAHCGRPHSLPLAAASPRCQRVRQALSSASHKSTCEPHNNRGWGTLICSPGGYFKPCIKADHQGQSEGERCDSECAPSRHTKSATINCEISLSCRFDLCARIIY